MLADLTRRGLANINIRELRSMCRRNSLSALSGRDQHDRGPRREYAAESLRSAERADLGLPVTALPAVAEAVDGGVRDLSFGESVRDDGLLSCVASRLKPVKQL